MQSDSETAFRRLEAWIEDCSSNHPYCGKPADDPNLPTRVIDVAASDRQVVLFESRGARGKYVALSHTWGSFPRLTATRQTFEDLKAGVAVSFLPKTFFDAIRITRRLGVRYIWIDCLCIYFNGSRFLPGHDAFELKPFDKEVPIHSLELFPVRFRKFSNEEERERGDLVKRGTLFANMMATTHKRYRGVTLTDHEGRKEEVRHDTFTRRLAIDPEKMTDVA